MEISMDISIPMQTRMKEDSSMIDLSLDYHAHMVNNSNNLHLYFARVRPRQQQCRYVAQTDGYGKGSGHTDDLCNAPFLPT